MLIEYYLNHIKCSKTLLYNYDEKQMRITYYALNNKDVLKELKSRSINKWSVSNNLNVTIQQNAITVNKDGKEESVEVDPHKLTYD